MVPSCMVTLDSVSSICGPSLLDSGLGYEYKSDRFQDIRQRIEDELNDHGYKNPPISYHQTSIYDYSIFEAFSKVIQKLVPPLATLENLLNILVNNSGMEKAYLFDTISKIYVASDTRPIDMEVYEMCSDYIDVILDISELYSYPRPESSRLGPQMDETESSVTIHDGTMIYLKEMNKYDTTLDDQAVAEYADDIADICVWYQ